MTEAAAPLPEIAVEFATSADDPELRRLLREVAMPGAVSITMEREPSFFLGAAIEGDMHDTAAARLGAGGRLVGLGSRSERDAYLNGKVGRLGYLSQVRIEPGFRGKRGLLKAGFALLGERQAASESAFCVTTIIEDNRAARRVLARGHPGLPAYTEREVIVSLAIPLRGRRPVTPPAGVELRPASAADLPEIAGCLQRRYAPYQFAPHLTAEDLADPARSRGLSPQDFTIALSGGRVVGCVAVWDQQAFKQVVVRGYAGALGRVRPLANLVGPFFGVPRLPRPGEAFRFAYLSHLAADPDDAALWMALLAAACNAARERGMSYVSVGLAERHPRAREVRRAFRHIAYRAILYTVHWDERGAAAVAALDGRVPQVEIATL